MNKPFAIIIVVALAVVLVAVLNFTGNNGLPGKACTEEAKLCPDGSAVGRTGPNCEFSACPDVPPVTGGGKCFVGGCSGQVCSDQEGMASTCEYKEEYACYKTATCERQTGGACGWTETPTLNQCIMNAK